jgi:hypothetical protein
MIPLSASYRYLLPVRIRKDQDLARVVVRDTKQLQKCGVSHYVTAWRQVTAHQRGVAETRVYPILELTGLPGGACIPLKYNPYQFE